MLRIRRMKPGMRVLLAVVAGASVFGIVSAVQAAIPDANGVAHGCYYIPPKLSGTGQLPGDLRLVDTDKGQHCNFDEGSVDLATTGYVQSFQDTIMFDNDQGTLGAGNYQLNNSCPTGWIGFDASASANSGNAGGNLNLVPHAKWNHGLLATGTPDTIESYTFSVTASTHVVTNGVCVRAGTVGLAPVHGAPTAQPTATLAKIN